MPVLSTLNQPPKRRSHWIDLSAPCTTRALPRRRDCSTRFGEGVCYSFRGAPDLSEKCRCVGIAVPIGDSGVAPHEVLDCNEVTFVPGVLNGIFGWIVPRSRDFRRKCDRSHYLPIEVRHEVAGHHRFGEDRVAQTVVIDIVGAPDERVGELFTSELRRCRIEEVFTHPGNDLAGHPESFGGNVAFRDALVRDLVFCDAALNASDGLLFLQVEVEVEVRELPRSWGVALWSPVDTGVDVRNPFELGEFVAPWS